MRLEIRHETRYRYDDPVRESVMEVWGQPRRSAQQRLTRFSIESEPAAQIFSYADSFGNAVYHFDVPQEHSELAIHVAASVETGTPPECPVALPGSVWDALRTADFAGAHFDFLRPHGLVRSTPALAAFMGRLGLSEAPDTDPLTAMRSLTARIYEAFDYETGVTRADSPIDHAIEARRGVCQDFAHVMIAVARAWGVPARYVSGHLFTDRSAGDRSDPDATHAWVEVFLPSLGWVGLDPTNNCLAGERHVAVAVGRDYDDVPPTRGVFKGEATSELSVFVEVRPASAREIEAEFVRTPRVIISSHGRRLPPAAGLEAHLQQQQ